MYTCPANSLIDYASKTFMGMYGKSETNSKSYSSLPPHWSLSLRFDMLMFSSLDSNDYIEVLIDSVAYGKYSKSAADGVQICNTYTGYNDILNLYNKNISHTASTVTIAMLASTDEDYTNEGAAMRNLFLYVDTCDISCSTCSGPTSVRVLLEQVHYG